MVCQTWKSWGGGWNWPARPVGGQLTECRILGILHSVKGPTHRMQYSRNPVVCEGPNSQNAGFRDSSAALLTWLLIQTTYESKASKQHLQPPMNQRPRIRQTKAPMKQLSHAYLWNNLWNACPFHRLFHRCIKWTLPYIYIYIYIYICMYMGL